MHVPFSAVCCLTLLCVWGGSDYYFKRNIIRSFLLVYGNFRV